MANRFATCVSTVRGDRNSRLAISAFGKAAATFALVMIALVLETVALLPIVQVKYLMSRLGRRAMRLPR